ncbi:hypothetical protein GWK16_16315 [Roseomonas sp. JC162]|uniref:Uncharacterized protein n=1 Tax=Neoroseomonas marina TaxID=1232220 RepID=A0A848EE90_9PROT|nr:hypothetical protein [Neoroseomonas marina]NMJ42811.1 hypothetical protein [Neoroseomonas marina]
MLGSDDKVWRVNRRPRITAFELGEYIAADDDPRDTIVRGMKFERIARSTLYRTVRMAIARYLAGQSRDPTILEACRADLLNRRRSATSQQQSRNLDHEIAALDAFQKASPHLDTAGCIVTRASIQRPMVIEGVTVSVQPTIWLRFNRNRGLDLAGAVIVDPAKGGMLKSADAQAAALLASQVTAVMVHRLVERAITQDGVRASADHCIVFHSHRQTATPAPASHKRMARNVEAACRAIVRAWPDVEEPAGFDPKRATYRN